MKKACCSISILLFFIQATVGAQELHVFFDAHSKEVAYMMGGDTIHKPKVRKGEQIVFHLQNFNNFLYEARVEGRKDEVQVSSGSSGSGQLMPGLGGGSMSLFGGLIPFSGAAGTGLDMTKDIGFGGSGFGADAEVMSQLNQLKISYDAALTEMFRTEKQLNFIQEDLDNYVEAKAVNRIVLAELARLKRNDRLQPQQIKSLSLEYLEKIFHTESAADITLSGLLEKSDAKAELRGYQQKLEEEAGEYDRSRNKVASIVAQLALFQIQDKELGTWKNSASEVLAKSEKIQQTIAENKSRLQQFVAEAKNDDIQRLAALRYEYEAIAANDFSETFRMDADGDHTLIKVRLLPKDSTGRTDPQAAIQFPPLKIPVFGGLKINTSIGLSFGKFFDQPYSYFVKDSLIARQELDQFTPMLTSFFHFYPQSNGQVSVGGSFGIGLPIAGNDGQQSISFFLGPSLVIGKGERIVVSTGLMGGRKEKLANAYLVGDSFSSEIDNVPTYSRYEMGFFFGLSFNLISSK